MKQFLVTAGTKNKGKIFWYDGNSWLAGQDNAKISTHCLICITTSTLLYPFFPSTFRGNKVFSYKVGTGIADTELGFAYPYRTIQNSGDITFDFNY